MDRGPAKSFYMSNKDFLFSESYLNDIKTDEYSPQIQPIILNEFQPDQINYVTNLITAGIDLVENRYICFRQG